MRKLFTATLALSVVSGVGVAVADEVTGTVQKLEPERRAVWIDDSPYLFEEQAAPLKFQDVQLGEKLRLYFTRSGDGNFVTQAEKAK